MPILYIVILISKNICIIIYEIGIFYAYFLKNCHYLYIRNKTKGNKVMRQNMWNQLHTSIERSANVSLSCADSTFGSTDSLGFYAPINKEHRYIMDTGGLKEP